MKTATGDKRKSTEFKIGENRLRDNDSCYVIAEIGSNFSGDLDIARKSIDVAVECGADAVKFQTFKADEFVADKELTHSYTLPNGHKVTESQYDMFKTLELPDAWHVELRNHAQLRGVHFLSSTADNDAVDLLASLDVPALKIASEDLINVELLKYAAGKNLPIILSTGMADESEITLALELLKNYGDPPVMLLHCTSVYPVPRESCNLRRMQELKRRFELTVGFSDHTLGWKAAYAAVAMGARVIEKHFTLDCNLPGPDHQMSAEPDEFKNMVDNIRALEVLLGSDKVTYDPIEKKARDNFRRSIVAKKDLSVGHIITKADICYRRPGNGLKPYEKGMVIGKKLKRSVSENMRIDLDSIES